jgi:ATP-dependent DNA helicase RecG
MKMTEALLSDGEHRIKAVWFNQPYIAKNLKVGDRIVVSGKVSDSGYGLQLSNPSYEKGMLLEEESKEGLVPVYHLAGRLTQKQVRHLTKIACTALSQIEDWLPESIRKEEGLIGLQQALAWIHYPENEDQLKQARSRLQFDELFITMLQSAQIKQLSKSHTAFPQIFNEDAIVALVQGLPFELTADQKKAAWGIFQDLQKDTPMNRLLEGDVGSGKTIVACMAAYHTSINDQQTVVMTPTSILATQQYAKFIELLSAYGVTVALLTAGSQSINGEKATKQEVLDGLQSGEIQIVVGTHALISDGVFYNNLGLVVVDEQHRFGVEQRRVLKERNLSKTMPHFLSMTATPIPRSLALIIYGDLDVSIIKEKPAGRKEIISEVVMERDRAKKNTFIKKEIQNGRQVFVICPLIDPSDTLGVKSVTEEYERLTAKVFADVCVELLHGKLKPKEKERVMDDFSQGRIDVLVSTSVVEVGVDVPNATIMMIEGAERFGLAQLHQFRGRVGRGEHQSYCFFFPSGGVGQAAQERLHALEKTTDGFILAEYDLKVRGPGEVYGTRQTGLPELKIANIQDARLIATVKEAVERFLEKNTMKEYPLLHRAVHESLDTLHLE